jgi:ferredoxin
MRVTIERDQCTSCELCWSACPEVFEQNPDDEWSQIVEKYRVDGENSTGEVSEQLKDCVEEAAESCPVEIIHVE